MTNGRDARRRLRLARVPRNRRPALVCVLYLRNLVIRGTGSLKNSPDTSAELGGKIDDDKRERASAERESNHHQGA